MIFSQVKTCHICKKQTASIWPTVKNHNLERKTHALLLLCMGSKVHHLIYKQVFCKNKETFSLNPYIRFVFKQDNSFQDHNSKNTGLQLKALSFLLSHFFFHRLSSISWTWLIQVWFIQLTFKIKELIKYNIQNQIWIKLVEKAQEKWGL